MNRIEIIDAIARVVHETNKAMCEAYDDYTQPSWGDAPDWMKRSSREVVELYLKRPTAGADANHEAWVKAKQAAGWQWGQRKDADAKTHPDMVPFYRLAPEQKVKAHAIRQVVLSMRRFVVSTNSGRVGS